MALSSTKLEQVIRSCSLPIYSHVGNMTCSEIVSDEAVSLKFRQHIEGGGRLALMLYDPHANCFRMVGVGNQFTIPQVLFGARMVEVSVGESSLASGKAWLAAGAQLDDGSHRLEFTPNETACLKYAADGTSFVDVKEGIDWPNLSRGDSDLEGTIRSTRLSSNWVREMLMVLEGVDELYLTQATQLAEELSKNHSLSNLTSTTCFSLSVPDIETGGNKGKETSSVVCDETSYGLARVLYAAEMMEREAGFEMTESKRPLLIAEAADKDNPVAEIHFHPNGHLRLRTREQDSSGQPLIVDLNEL